MSYFTKRTTRIVAGTLVGALALSVSPILGLTGIASAADALPPVAEPIGAGNFCEGAPTTEPFTDVSASDPSFDEIVCLVATGLTKGTTPTTYSPNASITRRQMALFIKRTADLADKLDTGSAIAALPAYDGTTAPFTDIEGESTEAKAAIGQLSQAGIVLGTTATTYSPGANVTRRQMAAFVNRLQDFLTGDPFSTTGDFFDDDEGDTGEANLNAVASVGIFQGDGAGNVFPGANLTRRQMANILLRHAQVLFDAGKIKRAFGPASNQTFTVTPSAPVTRQVSTVTNPTQGEVTITATGLGTAPVNVAEFTCPRVTTDSAGNILFADADSNELADGEGSTVNVYIHSINGIPYGPGTGEVNNISPVSGSITIVIENASAEECVRVAIWRDTAGLTANALDLTNVTPNTNLPKQPAEAFGITAPINFVPDEAALGASAPTVVTANTAADFFTSATATYYYDSNDVFQYQGVGISLAQFESMISTGDVLAVAYNPDPAGTSTFNVTSDAAPTAPAITSATAKNLDGGATANDVQVVFTPSASNAAGVTYKLQRGPAGLGGNAACGGGDDTAAAAWTDVAGTSVANADGTRTFTDSNVPNGCYDYRIVATNPVSGTSANGTSWVTTSTNGVAVPAAADVTGPTALDTELTTSAGFGTLLDAGDVIKVCFDEVLKAPDAGDAIRVRDVGLDEAIITNGPGGNATFALGAAATTDVDDNVAPAGTCPATQTLVITITGAVVDANPGTGANDGIQIPATIIDASGVSDVAGNNMLVAAGERVIDIEAGPEFD